MALKVDHKARRNEIVTKSLSLFAKVGYRDVTYQMIAENCGVARTVLYHYFKNKRQIFNAAITETVFSISARYSRTLHANATADERLRKICYTVITKLFENRDFLVVIFEFVIEKLRAGQNMARQINRYTIGVRRITQSLIAQGIASGEYNEKVYPGTAMRTLYALFESTSMKLMVGTAVLSDCLESVNAFLDSLKNTRDVK